MVFPDLSRAVARLFHLERKADGSHAGKSGELMEGVRVSVLPVAVIMKTGENDRATGRAGGRGCKGVRKARALSSKGIKVRGLDVGASIASGNRTLVVGDKEDDIRTSCAICMCGANERKEQGKGQQSHREDE